MSDGENPPNGSQERDERDEREVDQLVHATTVFAENLVAGMDLRLREHFWIRLKHDASDTAAELILKRAVDETQ